MKGECPRLVERFNEKIKIKTYFEMENYHGP